MISIYHYDHRCTTDEPIAPSCRPIPYSIASLTLDQYPALVLVHPLQESVSQWEDWAEANMHQAAVVLLSSNPAWYRSTNCPIRFQGTCSGNITYVNDALPGLASSQHAIDEFYRRLVYMVEDFRQRVDSNGWPTTDDQWRSALAAFQVTERTRDLACFETASRVLAGCGSADDQIFCMKQFEVPPSQPARALWLKLVRKYCADIWLGWQAEQLCLRHNVLIHEFQTPLNRLTANRAELLAFWQSTVRPQIQTILDRAETELLPDLAYQAGLYLAWLERRGTHVPAPRVGLCLNPAVPPLLAQAREALKALDQAVQDDLPQGQVDRVSGLIDAMREAMRALTEYPTQAELEASP